MWRRLCVVALFVTALIHVAVVPEHLHEWPAAAAFFVALALVEVALAVLVVTRPARATLLAGAAVSVASAGLWVLSRTVGLPIGPDAFAAERVGSLDLTATALELGVAVLLAPRAIRPTT